jgi:hypothetical protein
MPEREFADLKNSNAPAWFQSICCQMFAFYSQDLSKCWPLLRALSTTSTQSPLNQATACPNPPKSVTQLLLSSAPTNKTLLFTAITRRSSLWRHLRPDTKGHRYLCSRLCQPGASTCQSRCRIKRDRPNPRGSHRPIMAGAPSCRAETIVTN